MLIATAVPISDLSAGMDRHAFIADFSGVADRNGVPAPWQLRVVEGEADVSVARDGHGPLLRLKARKSSFSLGRELSLDPRAYPRVQWTWQALALPGRGDVREKSLNDQALQVLVAFDGGKIVSYVWDTHAPEGTVADESIGFPFFLTVKVVVVKSGTADRGKWITISRDLGEDYRRLFLEEPRSIRGVRVQTNSQYTGDIAEGLVRSIVFASREAGVR